MKRSSRKEGYQKRYKLHCKVIKLFFMLNSAEHEIFSAIFIIISRENFMLRYILHDKIVVVSTLRFISRPNSAGSSMKKVL